MREANKRAAFQSHKQRKLDRDRFDQFYHSTSKQLILKNLSENEEISALREAE